MRWDWGDSQLDNIVEGTGGGCTWIDYDGDGWMDLFVTSGAGTEGGQGQQGGPQGQAGEGEEPKKNDDVIDAEYTTDDDEGKKKR